MKIRHLVKIFSDNGVLEGIFLPHSSNEYHITIDLLNGMVWTQPWECISRATFFPELVPKSEVNAKLIYPEQIQLSKLAERDALFDDGISEN